MNVFTFSLIILFFVFPIAAFLGLVSYILWYTLNSNSGVRLAVSWQGKPLITWELQTLPPTGKTCGSSPIAAQKTPAGKGYKVFLHMTPSSFDMPSILNTPANEIPIYFFHLPVTQREVLLVNILTDPILYESIIASPYYCNDPTFQQAIVLFQNYTLS